MGIITSSILLIASLLLMIKSADFAIKYSIKSANSFNLPRYVIGFLVVAVVSIMPETFVSITSAINNVPSFGLGVLFGSNVADLTIVFSLVVFLSGKNLKVKSKIIKNAPLYLCMISLPIILGLNGYFSRFDGLLLVVFGSLFYLFIMKDHGFEKNERKEKFSAKNSIFLLASILLLLFGANMTVRYGVELANIVQVDPLFVGMLIVGLGTTLPELFFSWRAAKKNHDDLALGDILGTVIADATIVLGIVALISPFYFELRAVYVTGLFMLVSATTLLYFMKTDRELTKKEATFLALFYAVFILAELSVSLASQSSVALYF